MDMTEFSGSTFMKLSDVKANAPIRLKIVGIEIGKYGRPDLTLDDGARLSCNATNTRTLCRAYGKESNDWLGREIELVVGEIAFQGEPREAILARPVSPPKAGNGSGDLNYTLPF